MRLVIITGMSGAGKSTALKMLEDVGYFCVDNLPVPLIPKVADLWKASGTEISKAALGVDIRSGQIVVTTHAVDCDRSLAPHILARDGHAARRRDRHYGQPRE